MAVLITPLLLTLLVAGALLLAFGATLARFGIAMASIITGLSTGAALGSFLQLGTLPTALIAVIFGCVGAITARLAFRSWMGITGALVLALLIPAAGLIYGGPGLPPTAGLEKSVEQIRQGAEIIGSEFTGQEAEAEAKHTLQDLRFVYKQNAESVRTWWIDQPDQNKRNVWMFMLAGLGLGFLLGFLAPKKMATAQSAVAGALLVFFAVRGLADVHFSDYAHYLPGTPRAITITVIIIASLGFIMQWKGVGFVEDKKKS